MNYEAILRRNHALGGCAMLCRLTQPMTPTQYSFVLGRLRNHLEGARRTGLPPGCVRAAGHDTLRNHRYRDRCYRYCHRCHRRTCRPNQTATQADTAQGLSPVGNSRGTKSRPGSLAIGHKRLPNPELPTAPSGHTRSNSRSRTLRDFGRRAGKLTRS